MIEPSKFANSFQITCDDWLTRIDFIESRKEGNLLVVSIVMLSPDSGELASLILKTKEQHNTQRGTKQ